MKIFELQRGMAAPARILAATYAHNQQYYDQADLLASPRKRRLPAQMVPSQMRKAASNIASVLDAAEKMREAAASLQDMRRLAETGQRQEKRALTAADRQDIKEQLRQLLSAYNTALQSLDEAQPYVKRSVRNRLSEAAEGYEIYGIRQLADGTMELDEEQLEAQMNAVPEPLIQELAGRSGLAEKLASLAEKLTREPASAMLGPRFQPQFPLPGYRYQMLRGNTFQSGMLFDFVI